jgi:hypothetical protein
MSIITLPTIQNKGLIIRPDPLDLILKSECLYSSLNPIRPGDKIDPYQLLALVDSKVRKTTLIEIMKHHLLEPFEWYFGAKYLNGELCISIRLSALLLHYMQSSLPLMEVSPPGISYMPWDGKWLCLESPHHDDCVCMRNAAVGEPACWISSDNDYIERQKQFHQFLLACKQAETDDSGFGNVIIRPFPTGKPFEHLKDIVSKCCTLAIGIGQKQLIARDAATIKILKESLSSELRIEYEVGERCRAKRVMKLAADIEQQEKLLSLQKLREEADQKKRSEKRVYRRRLLSLRVSTGSTNTGIITNNGGEGPHNQKPVANLRLPRL